MFNTIQLSKSSQLPLYLQLANGLALLIETGKLPPGIKLPSIRSLAKELRINRDTVVSAYKVLEQKGLVYGQTGSGTYVNHLANVAETQDPGKEPFSFDHKDFINFSSISLPKDFYKHKAMEEICKYLKEYSVQSLPSQIRIIQNLSVLIQSLPKFIDFPGVCIESPSNDLSIFKEHGFKVFEVPITPDGLDIKVLESYLKTGEVKYIYLMPYLQNPSTICYSDDNIRQILHLANIYGVYIIEVDAFSDLLVSDMDYIPLYSRSISNNVIYTKHFSQLYMPGFNCSFIVLPKNLSHLDINSESLNHIYSVLYSFFYNNIWHSSKEVLITFYKEKYLLLCDLLDKYLSPYISYTSTFGGLYVWVTLNTPSISAEDLCNELLARQILISPGSLFFSHKDNSPSLRISIAKANTAQIQRGIKILGSILSSSEFK